MLISKARIMSGEGASDEKTFIFPRTCRLSDLGNWSVTQAGFYSTRSMKGMSAAL